MFKNLKKYRIKANTFSYILFITLIFTYLINSYNFYKKLNINLAANLTFLNNIESVFLESVLSFILIAGFLFIFSFNKYVLKAVIVILLLITTSLMYYENIYGFIVDEFFIGAVLEDNKMAGEIINYYQIFTIAIIWLVSSFIAVYFFKIDNKKSFKSTVHLVNFAKFTLLPVAIGVLIIFSLDKSMFTNSDKFKISLSSYTPMNYIAAIFQYYQKIAKGYAKHKSYVDIAKKYKFSFAKNSKFKDEPLVVVMVIGESARVKNQHYYGYKRDTNPYTSKIKNLEYFKEMYSCGTYSRISVNCMLSYKTRKEYSLYDHETNIITVFKALGFHTTWVSFHTAYERGTDALFVASQNADEVYWSNAMKPLVASGNNVYDNLIFHFFDRGLNSKYSKQFYVLYILSAHTNAKDRYPRSARVFNPTCQEYPDYCDDQKYLNDYDNDMVYTDLFLSKLIQRLKNKNAMVLYVSDHGESLGVDHSGFLAHGVPYDRAPEEQKHVASLMWVSNGFKKLNPLSAVNMKKYYDRKISQDYVFSTLLDCISVKSKVVHKSLSLCR